MAGRARILLADQTAARGDLWALRSTGVDRGLHAEAQRRRWLRDGRDPRALLHHVRHPRMMVIHRGRHQTSYLELERRQCGRLQPEPRELEHRHCGRLQPEPRELEHRQCGRLQLVPRRLTMALRSAWREPLLHRRRCPRQPCCDGWPTGGPVAKRRSGQITSFAQRTTSIKFERSVPRGLPVITDFIRSQTEMDCHAPHTPDRARSSRRDGTPRCLVHSPTDGPHSGVLSASCAACTLSITVIACAVADMPAAVGLV